MSTIQEEKNTELLQLVEKFGFKFYGLDESGLSLVIAPTGEVVLLSVAYDFVKSQIVKAKISSGGIESFPTGLDLDIESKFESQAESFSNVIEKNKEEDSNTNKTQQSTTTQPTQVTIAPIKKDQESPYGDGFKTPINPLDVDKAMNYIKANSNVTKSDTKYWLAIQFKKFLESRNEYK
jgi:hypothetical protein